eukprot:g11270.t1
MSDIEREQRAAEDLERQKQAAVELSWARARRDLLLMRHPTNWAGCSLLQGPRPKRPRQPAAAFEGDHEADRGDTAAGKKTGERFGNHRDDRGWVEGVEEDSRPKLVPGAMLTLSHPAAEAIMAFTEEVLGEQDPQRRAKRALAVVKEAISEVVFANRRGHPRTGVLVTKLQAVARGWLARRLARMLLLRGGCRRGLDEASGAWQYVWTYRAACEPPAPTGDDGRQGRGGGEGLFRSWYPPVLLKNETLPSPRAALRRVEGEEKKREARLALANELLDKQRDQLSKRDVRAGRLLALAEVVKLVERATISLESAALSCFGIDSKPPDVSVKVLHPRGGEPGDGAREAVVSEIMRAWDMIDTKVREKAEAARIRAERAAAAAKAKPARNNSPSRGRGYGVGTRTPRPEASKGGRKKEALLSVPTTNDNLSEFEKNLLQDSLHEGASAAVASVLQRKRVPVAIHEASRLARNREAWDKKGTSAFGLGIQVLPPWARASHRFVALAHRGRLVAVSQASPFVYWETLASKANLEHVLRGILRPFLENTDFLRALFVNNGRAPSDAAPAAAADATADRRPTRSKAGGIREGDRRGGGEWSPPPSTDTPPSRSRAEENGDSREDGHPEVGDGNSGSSSSWGYRSSLSSRGCWKVDAWAAARRDGSVELGFDSAAFDVFVRPEDERRGKGQELKAAAGPAAVVTNVVPFRLVDGLPRELGPLLFDRKLVASLLAEDVADHRLASRDDARGRGGKQGETAEQGGAGSCPGEAPAAGEAGDALWVRKKASASTGPVLSHVHRVDAAEGGGKVEVRIRGEPLDAETLAMAGLPQDMAALVVTADVGPSTGDSSKRPGSTGAGASGAD